MQKLSGPSPRPGDAKQLKENWRGQDNLYRRTDPAGAVLCLSVSLSLCRYGLSPPVPSLVVIVKNLIASGPEMDVSWKATLETQRSIEAMGERR